MKAKNYEDGREAYVAAEVAKGVPEDEAHYDFTEGDPALHEAERAAEGAWLTYAESDPDGYYSDCLANGY